MKLKLFNKFLGLLSIAILLSFISCGDDEDVSISDNVHDIKIWDLGNAHDASDIRVDFEVNITNGDITEYWILIVKQAASINASAVQSFGDNLIHRAVFYGFDKKSLKLNSYQLDTDGEALSILQEYKIVIFTPENGKISNSSEPFQLQDIQPLTGNYVGKWDDNFYSDFGISAEITQSGNNISGIFYYTSNFSPCCGGSDDGTIGFSFDDEGNIFNFRYAQDLLNYMGGCPGTYEGDGQREGDFTFMINFTGNDCDGTHVGGVMRLTKRN